MILNDFLNRSKMINSPRVLELGTKRSGKESTTHECWVPNASEFIRSDYQQGLDVDVIADIHKLSDVFGVESFDIIISCSTFEHIKYPHLAAHEIIKTLKKGGILFLQTHQTFPLHSFPYDYFRFTIDGIQSLFGTKMGFDILKCEYEFPSIIHSEVFEYGFCTESFLNVLLFGEKVSQTPLEYIYEL